LADELILSQGIGTALGRGCGSWVETPRPLDTPDGVDLERRRAAEQSALAEAV
jgi:hypothetical protein